MTLIEFLEARISEDEADAVNRSENAPIHLVGCYYYDYSISPQVWTAGHCDCSDEAKARTIAEAAAKRAIVGLLAPELGRGYSVMAEEVLHILALPYSNHPDYREEWRP